MHSAWVIVIALMSATAGFVAHALCAMAQRNEDDDK